MCFIRSGTKVEITRRLMEAERQAVHYPSERSAAANTSLAQVWRSSTPILSASPEPVSFHSAIPFAQLSNQQLAHLRRAQSGTKRWKPRHRNSPRGGHTFLTSKYQSLRCRSRRVLLLYVVTLASMSTQQLYANSWQQKSPSRSSLTCQTSFNPITPNLLVQFTNPLLKPPVC